MIRHIGTLVSRPGAVFVPAPTCPPASLPRRSSHPAPCLALAHSRACQETCQPEAEGAVRGAPRARPRRVKRCNRPSAARSAQRLRLPAVTLKAHGVARSGETGLARLGGGWRSTRRSPGNARLRASRFALPRRWRPAPRARKRRHSPAGRAEAVIVIARGLFQLFGSASTRAS